MTQACLNLTWPVKHSKASNPCLFYTSLIDPCFILYKSHRPLFYSIQVFLSLAFSASKQSLLSLGKTPSTTFLLCHPEVERFLFYELVIKEEKAWPSLPLLDSSLLILTKQAKGVLVF